MREWLARDGDRRRGRVRARARCLRLPPEHAAALTRTARPNNLAASVQWIPLLGAVEDEIVSASSAAAACPTRPTVASHAVMAEESDQTVVASCSSGSCRSCPGSPRGSRAASTCSTSAAAAGARWSAWPTPSRAAASPASTRGRDAIEAGSHRCPRPRKSPLRSAWRDGPRPRRRLRPRHRLRRDPRAGRSGRRARERRSGAAPRRRLPDAGDRRRRARRTPPIPLAPFLHTLACLHFMTVALAGGRRRSRRAGGGDAARRMLAEAGLRRRRGAGAPARPDQPLLRRAEVPQRTLVSLAACMIHASGTTSSTKPAASCAARGARSRSSPSLSRCSRCFCASASAWCRPTSSSHTLWPDTVVTPGSLNRAVSHARRAIGDTHTDALIKSVSRRGYRFSGEVVALDRAPRGPVANGSRTPAFVGRSDARASCARHFAGAVEPRGARWC